MDDELVALRDRLIQFGDEECGEYAPLLARIKPHGDTIEWIGIPGEPPVH